MSSWRIKCRSTPLFVITANLITPPLDPSLMIASATAVNFNYITRINNIIFIIMQLQL